MNYKKTFWMNVTAAIFLPLLFVLSYVTDIDYVELTTARKIFNFLLQLGLVATPTVTALYLYKTHNALIRKLALLGNYCGVIGAIFYLLGIAYYHPSAFVSADVLLVSAIFFIFAVPCLINLKAVKAS